MVKRCTGFTFTAPRTLRPRNNSDAGPKTADSFGVCHTHSGQLEMTGEQFSADHMLKATFAKELCFFGTPRGRILKSTPIELLRPIEQSFNPTGFVETLRRPPYSTASERGVILGWWRVDRSRLGGCGPSSGARRKAPATG